MRNLIAMLFSVCLAASLAVKAGDKEYKPDFSPLAMASQYSATDEQISLIEPDHNASASVIRGYEIYNGKCAMCHSYGYEKGATLRLERRYQGAVPASIALRTDLSRQLIETFVRKETVGMPPFRITEISPSDMDDLVAYLTRLNSK